MSKKIFRAIITTAMIVLVASLVIINGFLYNYFNRLQAERLQDELALAAVGVENSGEDFFDTVKSSYSRFTLIEPDGKVVYDSEADSEKMANHMDRQEIKDALKNGSGSSSRYSSTLTERTYYEAVRLKNGNVLRISATQITIGALMIGMLPAICAIILFSIITAVILSQKMATAIVKPLENLDLENPDSNDTYEELTPILTKLNRQHSQIGEQIKELNQKSDEFMQITASMSEGLVLVNKKAVILSINSAAKKLFDTDDSAVGREFYTVYRNSNMNQAVDRALNGKHSEFTENKNGGVYRFMVNPIISDETIIGILIMSMDITESANAEQNRQEFTANVSHELKTPLQSIIGCAELLENGLVKPEDNARFIGSIKKEAKRLVVLINDIIRLSQLDEDEKMPMDKVDMGQVAQDVIEVLKTSASDNHVSVILNASPCTVSGTYRYLYEMLYNLCDNAIRYNKEGGSVTITIKNQGEKAVITVSDTGIGIPVEHQSRIFERFYRVDKSHSKETGGTGLGLSIVKHAVSYHGGTIQLDSRENEGTTITITL